MGAIRPQSIELGPSALYFVIFRRSGVGIFSRTLSHDKNDKEIQETLFSGLLSGIMTFADEMIGGQISSFKIEEKHVILEGSESDIVFCLVATSDDPKVRQLLFDIEKRFQLRFGDLSQLGFEFEEKALESFGAEIDRMVESWGREVAQSVFIRGLSFFLFEDQKCQDLSCEIALAFNLAWKRRRTLKSGLFKKRKENIARIVRLLFPCYLVPVEGAGFAIASHFFSDQSDLRKISPASLEKLHAEIQRRKDTISLLKEAAYQIALPKDNLGAKIADFGFRNDFNSALNVLALIPGWNSVKLPVQNEKDFVKSISSCISSAFQTHSEVRTLVEDTQTLIAKRFRIFEKEIKQEIMQQEENFRKERQRLSKEIDTRVAALLKKQREKRAEYRHHREESGEQIPNSQLTALDRETDRMIEIEENRLDKHDQKRKNVVGTLESQVEDARRLLRKLNEWSEQAIKLTLEGDKNIETSLIPPKKLMNAIQANGPAELGEEMIEGAIRIFIPFYVITYASDEEKREEVIGPGKITQEGNGFEFTPWRSMDEVACLTWQQVSKNIELVRNLESINAIRKPEARTLILDGLRRLKDKAKLIDEKAYNRLVEGCRETF